MEEAGLKAHLAEGLGGNTLVEVAVAEEDVIFTMRTRASLPLPDGREHKYWLRDTTTRG